MAFFDKFHDLDIWLPFINVKRGRDKKKERNGEKMAMVRLFWETRVLSDHFNLSRFEGLFVLNARNITCKEYYVPGIVNAGLRLPKRRTYF